MSRSFVVLVALAACGDNTTLPVTQSCLPGCPAARGYDAIAYDLHGSWDWSTNTLTGSEDITLDTSASGPIIELDSAVTVSRVHAGDTDLAFVQDTTKQTLAVDTTPIAAGQPFTVDYTAVANGTTAQTTGTSLIVSTSVATDPVRSRVVYTDSEPDRASLWHPVDLAPSDRALWSIDLAIDAGEDVIANGERAGDTMVNGRRVVSYALDKPIPAYMMAFAAGELEHTDRDAQGGIVPLSVWHRKGLVLDPQLTLDDVTRAMTVFDTEIMPYPWSRYSVVLLPYSGGMENATITFDNEESGQGPGSFGLVAHELAHHWFGDWVTMHGFDDVWFKEGMATVLQVEADQARRDQHGVGRLWGTDFGFDPNDAVVDDSLHGLDKYTSGPYERAAWTITQIRKTVGEDAFFTGLRAFLAAHALDSATGEQFIRSFPLDEPTIQALLAAITAKGAPALAVSGTDTVTLTLTDATATMIVPFDVTVVDAGGTATVTHVVPGAPATVTIPTGGYLMPDEADVHPPLYDDFMAVQSYFGFGAHFAPPPGAVTGVVSAFEMRSAAGQEKATEIGLLPIASPRDLAGYIAALGSDVAAGNSIASACRAAKTDATWLPAVEPLLVTPPRAVFDPSLEACDSTFARSTLEPEIATALASATPADLARVEYLLSFDYGADEPAVLAQVNAAAPSQRLLDIAAARAQNIVHARRRTGKR